MDDKKWIDIALKMEPHLKELDKIVKQSGLENISMYAAANGTWWATYIDLDETHYAVNSIDGKATQMQKNYATYYTKA